MLNAIIGGVFTLQQAIFRPWTAFEILAIDHSLSLLHHLTLTLRLPTNTSATKHLYLSVSTARMVIACPLGSNCLSLVDDC
ncbi:MAG: hypothetical protein ACYTXT_33920 [Nostoc sp.]